MNNALSRLQALTETTGTMTNLQQRIADVLHESSHGYASVEPETNRVDSIYDLLKKAEADLHSAQVRVDNLKWKLAKAREYQA